jgi:hypothetical protein
MEHVSQRTQLLSTFDFNFSVAGLSAQLSRRVIWSNINFISKPEKNRITTLSAAERVLLQIIIRGSLSLFRKSTLEFMLILCNTDRSNAIIDKFYINGLILYDLGTITPYISWTIGKQVGIMSDSNWYSAALILKKNAWCIFSEPVLSAMLYCVSQLKYHLLYILSTIPNCSSGYYWTQKNFQFKFLLLNSLWYLFRYL